MKQFIRIYISMALFLLLGTSAYAGGKVEVADDASNGTVTGLVNGTTVTLTVTPAPGYYIRKSDLVAEKTFMPLAASRRSVPLADRLEIVGDDPEDLSLQRTYTMTLPSEEYDVLVHASFTNRTKIDKVQVSLSETRFVYNAGVQRPVVSVNGLVEGRDYEVVYSAPASTEAGNYSLTVNGLSTYQGSFSYNYLIQRGGIVEVNSGIQHGTVMASVDQLTVTVTVTPADGYYFKKENLRVDKTYMPRSSRAATPIPDGLEINGDDPADLSKPRTYTVTLPDFEYDAWVDATFTPCTPLTSAQVVLSATSFIYNGYDQKPTVTLAGLTEGRDYTLTFAESEWKNVGTYSLSVKGESTYKGTITKSFTITKAVPVVTAPVANSLTFNRKAQVLALAGSVDGGEMQYSLEKDGTYTTTVPSVTNAGSYTLYYRVIGDSNHQDVGVKSVSVTVAPKVVSNAAIMLSQQAYVYDGMEKEPVVTVKDGESIISSSEYVVSYASNVNAGTAGVTVTDKEGGNYTVSGQTTFTITKANALIVKAPQAKSLTYSGAPQALIEEGVADSGQLLYSMDAEEHFSEVVPEGTDAASYTVYYRVVGDENHLDSETQSVDVTIVPKVVYAPDISFVDNVFVYNGTAKEPEVTVKDGQLLIPESEYNISYVSNVNAGEAKVVVSDEEGGNYILSGFAAFTISKASLSAITDNVMMKKGDPMPELTVRYKGFVNDETEAVIMKPCIAYCEEITDTIDGIYQILVSGGEAANYDFVYVNGSLTIYVPVVLADEAGNEVGTSVMTEEDTEHVVIVTLTEGMLNGTEEIPAELKGGEGETYQVTEVASEAFEEMPSNVIIELPDGISTTNPVTNVINGDGTCETLDLTDVGGYDIKKTLEVEEVVYEREVDSDVLTVCLPYSTEIPEDVTAYELNVTASEGVSFIPVTGNTLDAYQPYLLRPDEDGLSRRADASESPATLNLGAKNVTISPVQEDVTVSAGVFKLCGTVRGLTHAEGLELKAYVMQPDHTWKMTTSSAPEDADKPYLDAFQAYMQIEGGNGTEVISTEMEGVITIIHDVTSSTLDTPDWYDLMGRKLPGKPTKKGLYIYQGRKIWQ